MKKKLTNPFVLGLQGFLAGAALFWSSQALQPDEPSAPPPIATAAPVQQVAGL